MFAAFGRDLSKTLATEVLGVWVHDSDVLILELFQKGKRLAGYDSAPGYFENTAPVRPSTRIVKPLLALAPKGTSDRTLRRLLREHVIELSSSADPAIDKRVTELREPFLAIRNAFWGPLASDEARKRFEEQLRDMAEVDLDRESDREAPG